MTALRHTLLAALAATALTPLAWVEDTPATSDRASFEQSE